MWISVRERTGEVGTLRAIGMRHGRVLLMFMLEALLLGLFATTVGALAGAAVAAVIDVSAIHVPSDAMKMILMSDRIHLSVRTFEVLEAIAVFTGVAMVSALWPALKAARMQPVTAIQHVS
jgi:putative ABC transport system permease protein